MPEISRFYGIVIAMYHNEHGVPHFHAIYGEAEASIEIRSGIVRGELPGRVKRMVRQWLEMHQGELIDNWNRAQLQQPLEPIAPME